MIFLSGILFFVKRSIYQQQPKQNPSWGSDNNSKGFTFKNRTVLMNIPPQLKVAAFLIILHAELILEILTFLDENL